MNAELLPRYIGRQKVPHSRGRRRSACYVTPDLSNEREVSWRSRLRIVDETEERKRKTHTVGTPT